MKKLKRNYHTHTPFCHHAEGTIEEYVKVAVELGFDTIGISCHAPYIFRSGYVSDLRMTADEQTSYAEEIIAMMEKYRDKISIKLGYEAEYYPAHFEETLALWRRYPCDYLILGQHYYGNEYDDDHIATPEGPIHLKMYVDQVCAGMRTGLFTYVAHPDTNEYLGDEAEYLAVMREICEVSLETDTPLEINLLGIRRHRSYPKDNFWRMAGEVGCKVVVGSDAHTPDELRYGEDFARAMEMVDKYGLNYTDEITLKPVL